MLDFCANCGQGMMPSFSELCATCQEQEYSVSAHRDSMTFDEQVEWVADNITNGNLSDAITFMMRDGDIRVDSVTLALRLTAYLTLHQVRSVTDVTDQLIRLIDTWEIRR